MPRRPLSAYNYFFKETRAQVIVEREKQKGQSHEGRMKSTEVFASLGKEVASRWKNVKKEDLQRYQKHADQDMERYRTEMNEYHVTLAKKRRADAVQQESMDVMEAQTKKNANETKKDILLGSLLGVPERRPVELNADNLLRGGFSHPLGNASDLLQPIVDQLLMQALQRHQAVQNLAYGFQGSLVDPCINLFWQANVLDPRLVGPVVHPSTLASLRRESSLQAMQLKLSQAQLKQDAERKRTLDLLGRLQNSNSVMEPTMARSAGLM